MNKCPLIGATRVLTFPATRASWLAFAAMDENGSEDGRTVPPRVNDDELPAPLAIVIVVVAAVVAVVLTLTFIPG